MLIVALLVVVGICSWPGEWPSTSWPGRVGSGRAEQQGSGVARPDGPPRGLVGRPWGRRRRGGVDALEARAAVADLVAAGLQAGLPTASAWRLACSVRQDAASGSEDLLDRVLDLCDRAGTPAAFAARAAAGALHREAGARRKRAALLAGPRASMMVLTALPLVGPVLTALAGLPVADVYADPRALLSLTLGFVLTAAGWFTARAILAAAVRPARSSPSQASAGGPATPSADVVRGP